MTIALVQQAVIAVNSGTSGVSPTLGGAPATGSLLIMSHTSNAATMSAVSGYGVTTWAAAKNSVFNQYDARIWYGLVDTTPATTGTVTVSGSGYHCVRISEWSGIDSSGTLLAQNDADDSASGTAAATGPITGGSSPCLYVACMAIGGTRTASAGPTDGFTGLTTAVSPDSNFRNYGAYRIDSTAASATPGYTIGLGQWEMVIAAFKGTATASALAHPESLSSLRSLVR